MIEDFVKALRAELRERKDQLVDSMAGGGCSTYEAYQHACGEITGLSYAERALLDLQEKVKKAND